MTENSSILFQLPTSQLNHTYVPQPPSRICFISIFQLHSAGRFEVSKINWAIDIFRIPTVRRSLLQNTFDLSWSQSLLAKIKWKRFFIVLTPLGSYFGIKGFNFLVVQIIRKFKFFNMSIFNISNIMPCFFLLRDKINFEWPKLVSIGHCPRTFSKLFFKMVSQFCSKNTVFEMSRY